MTERPALVQRAFTAERELLAIDKLVHVLVTLAPTERSGKAMCVGCLWDSIIKPLTSSLLGYGRGHIPEQAQDLPEGMLPRLETISFGDFKERRATHLRADTETEKWLRTSEAWDAVTDYWLKQLEAADPGNGHGFGKVDTDGES